MGVVACAAVEIIVAVTTVEDVVVRAAEERVSYQASPQASDLMAEALLNQSLPAPPWKVMLFTLESMKVRLL